MSIKYSRTNYRFVQTNFNKVTAVRKAYCDFTFLHRSLVCGLHFDPSAYTEGLKQRLLKKYAVPTLFPQYPKYLQSKVRDPKSVSKRKPPTERFNPCPKKRKPNGMIQDDWFHCNFIQPSANLVARKIYFILISVIPAVFLSFLNYWYMSELINVRIKVGVVSDSKSRH
jgi:hypothetical protein